MASSALKVWRRKQVGGRSLRFGGNMILSTAQLQTIKAWIQANAVGVHESVVTQMLNALATPAFWGWKSSVTIDEIMRADGFDWSRVDNLTVGKARIWEWMAMTGTIDPSKSNIRAGVDAAWAGTAADLAVRAAVYTVCRRQATVVEKLFATGTGSTASPATFVVEGEVTVDNVIDALRS